MWPYQTALGGVEYEAISVRYLRSRAALCRDPQGRRLGRPTPFRAGKDIHGVREAEGGRMGAQRRSRKDGRRCRVARLAVHATRVLLSKAWISV